MSTRTKRLFAAMSVAALAMGSITVASAEEPTAAPATETLYISAGCPPSTPAGGTCTSTRWLGLTKGDATSNFVTSITPVDEVLYQTEGSLNWRDYPSDDIREGGYELRTDEKMVATVAVAATGFAINDTVHARIDGYTDDGDFIELGPLEQTVTVLPGTTEEVVFEFELPAELEGVTLEDLTFNVALHGINVYGGHIDQEGGSTVQVPYWDDAS